MSGFRVAHVGGAIMFGVLGAILIWVVPARMVPGISDLSTLGWIIAAWAIVWLIAEVLANGTARRAQGMQMLREASVGLPSMIGAAGTALLVCAPARAHGLPLHTLGWIVLVAGALWLVAECAANGISRSRGPRRRADDTDQGPIILG